MYMYYYILGAVVAAVLLWTIGSYLVIRNIEEPSYSVLEKKDGYEIRQYAPYILAQTTVSGDYDEATGKGFRIIADYIFGNNTKKESIAMTTPVLESQGVSEKISMTTPVLESAGENNERTIAFVLPSKYTLETLPTPNNTAVTFVEVPSRKVVALRFTWYASAKRMERKKALLESYLKRDTITATGGAETARYNPPLSMPLLLRNEVLIPIE
jgi:SOUL heme-binding protein